MIMTTMAHIYVFPDRLNEKRFAKLSTKPAIMLPIVDLPLPGGPLMKTCQIFDF